MTEPVTLEDVLALMDADWHWKPEHKALVHAAADVVKEAKRHRCDGHVRASGTTMYCAMCERLAALATVKPHDR